MKNFNYLEAIKPMRIAGGQKMAWAHPAEMKAQEMTGGSRLVISTSAAAALAVANQARK